MKNKKQSLMMGSLALSAMLLTVPQNCFALFGADQAATATEATQLLQFAADVADRLQAYQKLVEQYQTQVQSLSNHIQQTQMMIQNLQQLSPTQWSQFTDQARTLANIVQNGQAVSFAAGDIDDKFQAMFKGYSSYEASTAQELDERTETFAEQYKNMNASTHEAVYGSLRGLNSQMNDLIADDDIVTALKAQSQSADGQLKAIQAANEIALHQTDTLKRLHYTLMTQASTQAQWVAAQNERLTVQRALSERRKSTQKTDKNGGRSIDSFMP